MNYLNKNSPVTLEGNQEVVAIVGDYEVSASCENKMLLPSDSIWSKIKQERLGNF